MHEVLYETGVLLIRKALFIINKLSSDINQGINTLQMQNFNAFLTSANKNEVQSIFAQQKRELTDFLNHVSKYF